MDFESFQRASRPVAETALAALVAFALTVAISFPFVPIRHRLDFPLQTTPEPSRERSTPEDLAQEIQALGVAERVDLLVTDGESLLSLAGVEDPDEARTRVFAILRERGFEPLDPADEPLFSLEQLLEGDSRVLPALLTVQAAIFFVLGWVLARWRVGPTPPRANVRPGRAALVGFAAGIVALLLSVVLSWGLTAIGLPVEEQEWIREILARPGVLVRLLPLIAVIGPLAEEMFFRAYVFRAIRQEAGVPVALLISSLMFAVIHFNLTGFPIYFMISCVLGLAFQRTSSLITPMVGHVTNNSMVVLAALIVDGGDGS